jgi:hypothetical protein
MTPTYLALGRPATSQQTASSQQAAGPARVRARVFGGIAEADAQVSLLPDGRFNITADLADADVAEIAREFTTQHEVTGRAFAQLQLAGSTQGTHTLQGFGNVRLRGANIYRLPAIISLLNELRVRETGPSVFTSSDADFRASH